jgi:hypothetical protein
MTFSLENWGKAVSYIAQGLKELCENEMKNF